MTRHTNINQHAVKTRNTRLFHDLWEVTEVPTQRAELRGIRLQALAGMLERILILIHRHDSRPMLKQRLGMSATAQSAIKKKLTGGRLQQINNLG